MAFKVTVKSRRGINANRNRQAVDKFIYARLSKLWRDAGAVFVETIIDAMIAQSKPSIDTGMSAFSVLPLAARFRKRKELKAIIEGRIKSKARPGGQEIGADYSSPGILRSKTAGERAGKNAYEVDFGNLNDPVFILKFRIAVFQYDIHDKTWNTLIKASLAMQAYIKQNKYKPQYLDPKELTKWLTTGVIKPA